MAVAVVGRAPPAEAMECMQLRCTLRRTRCGVPLDRSTAPFACEASSSMLAYAYPRFVTDTAAARAGVVRVSRGVGLGGDDCVLLRGRTLIIPPPPSHAFHFLIEWSFHLFSALAAESAAHRAPPRLLILPPAVARDGRRTARLDAQSTRLYNALVRQSDAVVHATSGRAYCIDHAQIGMSAEVSLLASNCLTTRRFASARVPQSSAIACNDSPGASAALSAQFSLARSLTNCSTTRMRLHAFRSYVRKQIGLTPAPRPTLEPDRTVRVLVIQRGVSSRRVLGVSDFASRLGEVLTGALRSHGGGAHVQVSVDDFGSDMQSNAQLLQRANALVAVHGNALTNLLFAQTRTLRAAVQLLPSCLPEGALSKHAYETLGHVLLAGRFRSVCCACEDEALGKTSDVRCNATSVALELASMLRQRGDRPG